MSAAQRMLADLREFVPHAGVTVPEVSRWSVGMHVHHCCLAMIGVCRSLVGSTPPPPRSRFSLITEAVMLSGWIPRGRGRAPEVALPTEGISQDQLTVFLNRSEASLNEAAAAPRDAWFEHFAFGVMDRDRTLRFLRIHNRHHARIVYDILAG